MHLESLQGKVAVVTGASRGIGRYSALALAKEGVHIVATARTEAELKSLVKECEELGVQAIAIPADATKEADVKRLKEAALKAFPHIDILVNNAGVAKYSSLLGLSIEDYDWMMNTNVRSTFLCTHTFLPEMVARKSGTVIIISSQAGFNGYPGETVYCATKFAQVGFALALDAEVREHNIKVSIIAPGSVRTSFAIGTGRTEGQPDLEFMMEAEDVADAVVFSAAQPIKSRVLVVGMRPMNE